MIYKKVEYDVQMYSNGRGKWVSLDSFPTALERATKVYEIEKERQPDELFRMVRVETIKSVIKQSEVEDEKT